MFKHFQTIIIMDATLYVSHDHGSEEQRSTRYDWLAFPYWHEAVEAADSVEKFSAFLKWLERKDEPLARYVLSHRQDFLAVLWRITKEVAACSQKQQQLFKNQSQQQEHRRMPAASEPHEHLPNQDTVHQHRRRKRGHNYQQSRCHYHQRQALHCAKPANTSCANKQMTCGRKPWV